MGHNFTFLEFEIKKLPSIQYQNTQSNTRGTVKEFAWNGLITFIFSGFTIKKIFKMSSNNNKILQMLCDNYIKNLKIKLKNLRKMWNMNKIDLT